MLPVSVGLGLINVGVVLNSVLGSLVSPDAPRAIDAAFRLYTLPQGMFSVAVTTVLYPLLARLAHRRDFAALRAAAATGMRQIALLLIPSAAVIVALATPITRLVYERGQFDAESTRQVAKALFWFSFALPLGGLNLLLTRTFFALQRPWLPTRLALGSLLLNTTVSLMLFKPLGISGIIIGTVMASAAMVIAQAARLRRELDGMELGRTLGALALMLTAATILASVAWLTWTSFDLVFGRSLVGQLASVGAAILAGGATYAQIVLRCGLPEAQQIAYGVRRRLAMAGRPATTKT
jgi:putative peptidoglycan lipid II flippase